MTALDPSHPASLTDADAPLSNELVDDAVALVEQWLAAAADHETARSRRTMAQLEGVVVDPAGLGFVMDFVDRVARPDDDAVAAEALASIVAHTDPLPAFLSPIDRALLRAGAALGPHLPAVVVPLARRRMRAIVGRLVAPAEPVRLARHLDEQRRDGWASNVNLLGEAVLGDAEADRRRDALLALIADPEVDYVSVKLSSVVAQLPPWAHDEALDAVADRLATLLDAAATSTPPTFVNVDMEEYRDLELTLDAFERVLDDPTRRRVEAGIVLQAYLPDALGALQRLSAWAARRVATGGAPIKVRLVKGANLAMEQTEAQLHGWPQAPYGSKAETDANYVRCVDWVLHPERVAGLRIGLASHNLFHVALTRLLAERRGVLDRVQFEMLQGMAEAQAAAAADDLGGSGHRPLLYVPTVDPDDFDVAIGYLFRRLDENAAPDNFLRALFSLAPGSPTFTAEATRFRASVADRDRPTLTPRRVQDRRRPAARAFEPGESFRNEPDTDPVLPANRAWLDAVGRIEVPALAAAVPRDVAEIDAAADRARAAQARWAAVPPATRRLVLHRIGDELAARRCLLVATMAAESGKVIGEADPEVSEAIDFARYDAERAVELARPGLRFEPLGLVAVVPPWNFPVAIPAGGVLAALAAGNAVLFKPAPETRRCAEVVHDAIVAGLAELDDIDARDLVAFVPTDDDVCGRRVIETADAVVLTGASETAELFRSWNPELRLFAETSGKNALVITPSADLDLAIADLVRSAFGHAGQKCSAASLAICVGGVARSERFRRQLVDAVTSLTVGAADDPAATVGPLIGTPNPRLARALTRLDAGESWLVEPRLLDVDHHRWTPGMRTGVRPGSWFARTECFGPVLGIVEVDTLDDAIAVQNASAFGLTGGIHSLDPDEIDRWLAAVEVGNAYVNRHITGAIVQRQPFGGWKRSSVGPGAKAGGPNYVAQLGTWHDDGPAAALDDAAAALRVWRDHFAVEHDPTGLAAEANVFRYRPLDAIVLRHGAGAGEGQVDRFRQLAAIAGVEVIDSDASVESDAAFAARLPGLGVERVRVLGASVGVEVRAAAGVAVHLADAPMVGDPRIEFLHLVREQAISRTLHRFGNLPPSARR